MKDRILQIIQKIRKFNTFDYVFVIIVILIALVFLYIRFSKKKQWIPIRIEVRQDDFLWKGTDPEFWYMQNLKPGDESYNAFGSKVAIIKNIDKYDQGGNLRFIQADIQLLATFNPTNKVYTFNYQPLQIGRPIDLTFSTYNVHGIVKYIGALPQNYQDKTVDVHISAINPWQADSYVKGMQMKDSQGNVVAEITKVDVQPAKLYQINDIYGRNIIINGAVDDIRKDVIMTLKLKTYSYENRFYYIDGSVLKIGESLFINFDTTTIKWAEITKIYN